MGRAAAERPRRPFALRPASLAGFGRCLLAALCPLLFADVVRDSFEELPVGARAAGLSETYAAVADDVLSVHYNPAGLALVRRPEAGTFYSRLFLGLDDKSRLSRSFVGYAHPLPEKKGVLGAGYVGLSLAGLYREDTLGLSYGRTFKKDWNLGGTVKLLRRSFGSDLYTENAIDAESGAVLGGRDPVFKGGRDKTAPALDLGAQWRFTRKYNLGLALRNVNQPDLSLGSGTADRAPSTYALGLARRTRYSLISVEAARLGRFNRVSAGGEGWSEAGFGFRGGLGLGSRDYANASAGISYRMDGFQFDYGLGYPLKSADTAGTHMLSMTFRFGRPPPDPLEVLLETQARELMETKRKLMELMRRTAAAPPPVVTAPPPPKIEEPAPKARPKPAPPLEQYRKDVLFYEERVKAGASVQERISILERLLRKYDRRGIDLAPLKKELASLQASAGDAVRRYQLAVAYYRKIVEQGVSTQERIGLLDRVIKKYKPLAVDTAELEQELETLRAGVKPGR
jgi:hypothetical protein